MDKNGQYAPLGGSNENVEDGKTNGQQQANGEIPKLLYTMDQARAALNLSKWKLFREAKLKRLRTVKAGRRRLVSPAALQQYVELLHDEEVA